MTTAANKGEEDYKDNFLIKFLDERGAFDLDSSFGHESKSKKKAADKARIPQPATKEELKKNQLKQHEVAAGGAPSHSPQKKAFKSILGQTNGNDD